MDVMAELQWRQSVHQTTDDAFLPGWLAGESRTLYAGFDPTSNGLHVGNFVPLMMLRRFQQAGHRPIALAGGATGMIGDPAGKSDERSLLSAETIEANLAAITVELQQFLDFDQGPYAARLVNNYDWMKEGLVLPRLPAGHRQKLPGQCDAGQGFRQRTTRPGRRWHQLYRIQLHALASV